MRLRHKVVAVTGSTGIAAATARLAASDGADVFVIGIDPETAETLAEEIGGAAAPPTDLTDERATVEAFADCIGRFGRIDGLVAVAGGSGRRAGDGPLDTVPLAGWEETIRINGHPAFLAAREAVRAMLTQDPTPAGARGSVVLIASVLAIHPSPALFATHAYAAVKGAELALMRTMAAYYAPSLIRVNAVAPGLVRTPMSARAAADPETVAFAARKQPLAAGFLAPDDIAHACVFLLGDESRAMTGQVLEVDGGWGVTEAVP
jgi:NAD(P)-dependent dehydrogenase (short-subunit alcohol dehydrogenase family)